MHPVSVNDTKLSQEWRALTGQGSTSVLMDGYLGLTWPTLQVTVYHVSGVDDTAYTHEEQVARLDRALAAKDKDTEVTEAQ